MSLLVRRIAFLAAVVFAATVSLERVLEAQSDPWAEAMAAFEQQDRQTPPKPGGIVFVGSSSIRRWELGRYFPAMPVVNRGFGGSEISDSVSHVDLLVLRHRPRTVVFYAGDNDLAAGKTPRQVAVDFRAFVERVRAALPMTRIAFIGIKPSIQRWKLVEKMREANVLIRTYREGDNRLGFIDVDGPCSDGTKRRAKTCLSRMVCI